MPVYSERNKAISKYLDSLHADYEVRELGNTQGDAIDNSDYAGILASRETEKNVRDINVKRIQNGLKPVEIRLVDTVLAQDLFPISSRRIASGEIDTEGKRLTEMSVSLLRPEWLDSETVEHILKKIFGETKIKLKSENIQTFPEHSKTSEMMASFLKDLDYSIALFMKHSYRMDTGRHYTSMQCRMLDRYGLITEGSSGELELWDSLYHSIMDENFSIFKDSKIISMQIPYMLLESINNAVFPRVNLWEYGFTHYFMSQP